MKIFWEWRLTRICLQRNTWLMCAVHYYFKVKIVLQLYLNNRATRTQHYKVLLTLFVKGHNSSCCRVIQIRGSRDQEVSKHLPGGLFICHLVWRASGLPCSRSCEISSDILGIWNNWCRLSYQRNTHWPASTLNNKKRNSPKPLTHKPSRKPSACTQAHNLTHTESNRIWSCPL